MVLTIGDGGIRSDRCPKVAMAIGSDAWVLSFRPGRFTADEAIRAISRAEHGDLATDPTAVPAL
ncbi:MAG: hypothetical protein ACJ72W_04340 [Actinoallomurus sp.]